MLTGLALAETTPGPLIQVVQFVGSVGAFHDPGTLHPLVAVILAAILVTWVTFTPCFLWIFVGAPYVELVRGKPALTAALSSITAAVVGVIASLALWFAMHTLFRETHAIGPMRLPVWTSINLPAITLAAISALCLLKLHWGVMKTLALALVLGLAWFGLASLMHAPDAADALSAAMP
jgi:chromate transporter